MGADVPQGGSAVMLQPVHVWTRSGVQAFLESAMALERRLPDRERRWHMAGKVSHHPPILRTRAEMDYAPDSPRVRLGLSTFQLAMIDKAYAMLATLDKRTQQAVVLRARRRPWAAVVRHLGCSRQWAHRLHRRGLEQLAVEMNQQQGVDILPRF